MKMNVQSSKSLLLHHISHWIWTYAGLILTESPPKIKTIRIVENPFDDIVPRITAAEKREQMKAKLEAKVEMEKRDKRSKAKKWVFLFISVLLPYLLSLVTAYLEPRSLREMKEKRGAWRQGRVQENSADNRNTGLLSFGEAEEGSEAGPSKEQERKRKGLTRMDRTSTLSFRSSWRWWVVVEDSRPNASEDMEAAADAGPSVKSTGEKKEKVSPPTSTGEQTVISRKQQ
jgi:hypothetical protein